MCPLIDLTGKRYSRLFVVRYAGVVRRKPHWLCLCDCGNETTVRGDMLKCGNTQSCGCLLIESATKHGHNRVATKGKPTPTYISWQAMIARCLSPTSSGYNKYGALGVGVCESWRSFESFLADMGERPAGMTLDRIDPTGDYTPENCRWATPVRQARNRRNTRYLTHAGTTKSLSDWAEYTGLPFGVLADRLRSGWGHSRILTTPYTPRKIKR